MCAITEAPEGELGDEAVDSSLGVIGTVSGAEALDPTATRGFGRSAANLLKATKSIYTEARRRRRLAEATEAATGNTTGVNATTDPEVEAAKTRSAGVLSIISAVANGACSGGTTTRAPESPCARALACLSGPRVRTRTPRIIFCSSWRQHIAHLPGLALRCRMHF